MKIQEMGATSMGGRKGAALERLAAVVLLGGSVRTSRLSQVIGRPVLDLPLESNRTILECWRDETGRLASASGLRRLAMRVMVDRDGIEPKAPVAHEHTIVSVERDPLEYRGTGGVLKDLSCDYADDDCILVASAAQVLLEELKALAEALAGSGASDVSLLAPRDGAPAGLMLIRCAALRGISETGFVDLKEQALPAIAQTHRVDVVQWHGSGALAVRNVSDYITALRRHHQRAKGRVDSDPYAEDWESAFSIVEAGAEVSPQARVHDSVVLRGAKVESGAVVVRCVIGPGGVASKGRMAVEELLGGSENGRGTKPQ